MQRSYDIKQYVNVVKANDDFFRQYYFHSIIDLNLIKLDHILKYGILSRREIEKLKLFSFCVHDLDSYDCKNGYDFISLVDYDKLYEFQDFEYGEPKHEPSFNSFFEAFALHTLTSISLLISRDIEVFNVGQRETLFDDEVFARDNIASCFFKGILIPEHLTNLELKEISFLPGDRYCYTLKSINHLVDELERYFGLTIDRKELIDFLKDAWNIFKTGNFAGIRDALIKQRRIYGKDMKDILAYIISDLWKEKTGIENPTYIDIVKYINNGKYPIYEIGGRQLTKLKK